MRYPGRRKKSGGMVFPAVAALLIVTAAINFWFGSETAGAGEESSEAVTENTNPSGNGEETQTSQEDGQDQQPQDEPQAAVIRVALFGDDYGSLYQEEIRISSSEAYTLSWNGGERQMPGDSILTLTPSDECFAGGSARIRGTAGLQLLSSHRECGYPLYPGEMEVIPAEGKLAVVNEVSLEDYLCLVVPGEMPVSYGLEALKVQAICARSYAWCQMQGYGVPALNAHVDDSTNFQVYNNQDSSEKADEAVRATAGQVLNYQGETVNTYYYSSSCGSSTDMDVWKSDPAEYPYFPAACLNASRDTPDLTDEAAFRQFIDDHTDSFDQEDGFYRWQVDLPKDALESSVNKYLTGHKMSSVGEIAALEVTERGAGGIIRELTVTGSEGKAVLSRQEAVRKALGNSSMEITQHTGYVVKGWSMLPSAFFYLERLEENGSLSGYRLHGGGYGHGVGMSQSGAGGMAEAGYTYDGILSYFYPGTELFHIY